MKILWLAAPPADAISEACGVSGYAGHAVSWITGHLPPPSGIDLHLACPAPAGVEPGTTRWRGATLHFYRRPRRGRSLTLFAFDHSPLQPLVARIAPDIIQGWGTEDSHARSAVRLAPDRHVVGAQGVVNEIIPYLHPSLRLRILSVLERQTFRRCRYVATESHFVANAVRRLGSHAQTTVIPQPLRRVFLETDPWPEPGQTILFLGHLVPSKGWEEALSAFAAAAPPTWRFHLIGSATPETLACLNREASRLGIANRVRHEQGLSEIQMVHALQQAPILLLPTRVDSGPTALKEALAMGLWPICFDNSGPAEFIRLCGAGTLVPDGNTAKLASALARAIEEQPWTNREQRRQQIARARQLFSPQAAWLGLQELYTRILAENP